MTPALDSSLTLTLNGRTIPLKDVSPTLTLLQYLNQSGQTGTKEGCGDGDCGACTVVILGQDADGQPTYQAVNSCLMPLGSAAGREILTVEGISQPDLHPVQTSMIETGGSQCGYCTPGFIMSLFAAYYADALDDRAIEGNLCRCTGYLSIRRAIEQLQDQPNQTEAADQFQLQLQQSTGKVPALRYHSGQQQFYRPTQLAAVLSLLQQYPTALLIAGGTDLGVEFSHHRQQAPIAISLEAVTELQQFQQTSDMVSIGAAVPLSRIETQLKGMFPALDEMLIWFAARQVRNRATLGGNIGTASPIGDLPPVLLSLEAVVEVANLAGNRSIPIADFFTGYRQTVLQPGEVIYAIHIPKHPPAGTVRRLSQSYKVGKRGTDDISIVAAAFTVDLDSSDRVVQARLGYGGVAATPARAIAAEQFLQGQPWTRETIQQVQPILTESFTPLSDLRGSAAYRSRLIGNLFEKFFVEMNSAHELPLNA